MLSITDGRFSGLQPYFSAQHYFAGSSTWLVASLLLRRNIIPSAGLGKLELSLWIEAHADYCRRFIECDSGHS
jgi:hypothetical protein